MIWNIIRTASQLRGYLERINYPLPRLLAYVLVSVVCGYLISGSPKASDLRIMTLTAILFGFTVNAVVMLGNSSEQYTSSDGKHSEALNKYYTKSLYASIHTLGIGLLTIIVSGVYLLFPDLSIDIQGVQLFGALVYALVSYYLITFSIVIANVAELALIRVRTT